MLGLFFWEFSPPMGFYPTQNESVMKWRFLLKILPLTKEVIMRMHPSQKKAKLQGAHPKKTIMHLDHMRR
jgi:mannose-6-phosphate isomerase class I